MKKSIINILAAALCLAAAAGCEKWTTPEPVRTQHPESQSPFTRDDAYFARLRQYKKSEHKIAFGWFGSWTAIGASEQSRLSSAPDSMDIISMWSTWHSLNAQQMADKAFVQNVLGTKVVFCISAKDCPEIFKEQGVITEASVAAYARAWGRDSMDKYSYDGIDIDFETATDHQGPLSTNKEMFYKFCLELSKYIGPQSGTGRLFIIDGNIDASSLDGRIPPLCDYAVSQAYSCSAYSNLDSRTNSAVNRGWTADRIIFTENFESLWSTGGVNHSLYGGGTMPSLLGMACYAARGSANNAGSAGFGAYHMEYEYGHSDMPYKYMRQAIQLANPAPEGDYSKNLVTLNEAGDVTVNAGAAPLTYTLTARLSAPAAGVATLPLKVDNAVVAEYNDYHYTDYATLDPSLVSFSGPLLFDDGEMRCSEPVAMTIADLSSLESGKTYMIPVAVDFARNSRYSANTKKQYFNLILHL